ncbi:MAG TPA: PAS domain S-box protein, partial [Gaiellaceae bacterium]|nr:PAS domain S-box protein [Gaiellaceae bacterium]
MAITAAALGSADERMQRTERQLIDAALAVNEAPTLEEALTALTEAALDLIGAARVAIAEWSADCAVSESRGEAGVGAMVRRPPIPSTEEGRRLISAGEPFAVDPDRHFLYPLEIRTVLAAMRTRLCVPLPLDRRLSFFAYWPDELDGDDLDRAVSKLRLLGRLSSVALRAEQEREQARADARLRAVLEAVPDGLVVRSDRSLLLNSAARELVATAEEIPEDIGLREPPAEEVASGDTPLARATRTGAPQSYTMRVKRLDGVERVHEGRIAPVLDEHGSVFATVTLFRDITEEHEQRFITEQFLQRLFDELPTPVAVVEPDSRVVQSANRAFLDLVGLAIEDVVGQRPPYPWWADQDTDVPARADASRWEWLYRRADGSPVPVEVSRSLVHSTTGDVAAVVVIANDLSERREFERQLIQSGKLASIGELAAGVAHEINNPLFAILGFVEFLLLDVEPGTKSYERLELIQGTALEIKEIVRALLDFARERSDERAVISLTDVASQTVELMRRTSAAKQVEIVERYTDADVRVDASANQLKQIFVNLISNSKVALKETGGTITVEVGRDGCGAWTEVRDNGPGIPADLVERVFEPFFTTR